MGMRRIGIKAADDYAGNSNGTNYLPSAQISAIPALAYKVNIYCESGATQPLWLWLIDTAAGSASSVDPKHVRALIAGASDTWDLGPGGSVFKKGIYLVISTTEPTSPTATPTAAGNNQAIVTVDFNQS